MAFITSRKTSTLGPNLAWEVGACPPLSILVTKTELGLILGSSWENCFARSRCASSRLPNARFEFKSLHQPGVCNQRKGGFAFQPAFPQGRQELTPPLVLGEENTGSLLSLHPSWPAWPESNRLEKLGGKKLTSGHLKIEQEMVVCCFVCFSRGETLQKNEPLRCMLE